MTRTRGWPRNGSSSRRSDFAVPDGPRIALDPVKQSGGKIVTAFAVEADLDVTDSASNTFELEWPKGSGTFREFPEVDRVGWFSVAARRSKLLKGQRPLLDRPDRSSRRRLNGPRLDRVDRQPATVDAPPRRRPQVFVVVPQVPHHVRHLLDGARPVMRDARDAAQRVTRFGTVDVHLADDRVLGAVDDAQRRHRLADTVPTVRAR